MAMINYDERWLQKNEQSSNILYEIGHVSDMALNSDEFAECLPSLNVLAFHSKFV
jgi:hypothetical protein